MATTTIIDDVELELAGQLTASPVAHPLTLKYAGDEPYYEAVTGHPETLLVHIHAWSSTHEEALGWPQLYAVNNCVWVCPNFGGFNNHPQGAGHPAQLERIKRVIDKTRAHYVTIKRVILMGYSGGSYVALYFMGKHPEMVDGFSVWVGIHNLAQWWQENTNQRSSIEACLGGPPAGREAEYLARSPAGVLSSVSGKRGWINSGLLDTEVLPHHPADSYAMLQANNDVTFRTYNDGHVFQPLEAVAQINGLISEIS
jgi:pimeloyl-ACP methyl ester carboxylesterase